MNLKLFLIIFLSCLILTQNVNALWPFSPSNCDECILKYVKNTQSGAAVLMIKKACKDKFYKPTKIKRKKIQPDNKPFDINKFDFDAVDRELAEQKIWSKNMCDCILDNMPGAENNQAARLIFNSCKKKTGKWLLR